MVRPDIKIETQGDLEAVLANIQFDRFSILNFNWTFRFRPCSFPAALDQNTNKTVESREGWLLWAEFERPDINTGKRGIGRGRDEIILKGMSESGVVKTAWVLVEMLVKHELMEGFMYEDIRIFNPHNTVSELQLPVTIKDYTGPG